MKMADSCVFPRPFEYSYIDTIALSRHDLYLKAYEWFANNITNYNLGLQMQDSSIGKIVLPEIECTYGNRYRYTVTLDTKDGKYRIVFSDFYLKNDGSYAIERIPIDTVETFKMIYFGPGSKHDYWQAEKLHLRQESEMIYASLKAFIHKRDDF